MLELYDTDPCADTIVNRIFRILGPNLYMPFFFTRFDAPSTLESKLS